MVDVHVMGLNMKNYQKVVSHIHIFSIMEYRMGDTLEEREFILKW
jgi:hypothetical protein